MDIPARGLTPTNTPMATCAELVGLATVRANGGRDRQVLFDYHGV